MSVEVCNSGSVHKNIQIMVMLKFFVVDLVEFSNYEKVSNYRDIHIRKVLKSTKIPSLSP